MNCEELKLSQTQEVWMPITDAIVPNIKPYYYASNWGRIGSTANDTFEILTLTKDDNGYLNVNLQLFPYVSNNKLKRQIVKRVNRLIMMAFYPIPYNYQELEVHHINHIRDDNSLWNLQWVTPKENTHFAIKYGNHSKQDVKGINNPMAKLTDKDVYDIVNLMRTGNYKVSEVASMYNIKDNAISDILNKRTWTHLNLNITDDDIGKFHNQMASFNDDEMRQICQFFEDHDINNKYLYPKMTDVLKDCFYSLELDKKYNYETKRKTLSRILQKSRTFHDRITSKYKYEFIR